MLKELLGVYFWREGLEAALGPEGAGTLCDEGANQLNFEPIAKHEQVSLCLLYTSDAADDLLGVVLVGRRIIKKQ